MNDKQNKDSSSEQEFYNLLPRNQGQDAAPPKEKTTTLPPLAPNRKPRPDGKDSSHQDGESPSRGEGRTMHVAGRLERKTPVERARREPELPGSSQPYIGDERAQTRLTPISRNGLSGELPPPHPPRENVNFEQEMPRRPQKNFHLRVEDELKKIPDYTVVRASTRRSSGAWSAFAKVMFAIVILGISVLLSIGILFCVQEVFGFGKSDQPYSVDVPRTAGLSMVSDKLEAVGVIRSSYLFKVYFKLTKPEGEFQYGTYDLNSKMSYDEIISALFEYSTTKEEVTVTFPEGFTLYQMAERLEEKGVCDAADFLKTLNELDFSNYDFIKAMSKNPLRYHTLEGYLFPDTYKFYKHDDPLNVAKKMMNNFAAKTADLETQMKEMNVTLEQTMVIASIVQRESSRSADMKMVASIYWNRVNNAGVYPNLQADPTKNYAEELRTQMGTRVNENILKAYDTYEGTGLPPGPICNPGYDAIEATLNPAQSDYYYFCNNLETGEFFYAKTLEQHQKNLVKAGLVK